MTRFSVIVPVPSAESTVYELLSSLRRQVRADVEIIGIYDHSTDDGAAIIDSHARQDDRVSAVLLSPGRGAHGPRPGSGATEPADLAVGLLEQGVGWEP